MGLTNQTNQTRTFEIEWSANLALALLILILNNKCLPVSNQCHQQNNKDVIHPLQHTQTPIVSYVVCDSSTHFQFFVSQTWQVMIIACMIRIPYMDIMIPCQRLSTRWSRTITLVRQYFSLYVSTLSTTVILGHRYENAPADHDCLVRSLRKKVYTHMKGRRAVAHTC